MNDTEQVINGKNYKAKVFRIETWKKDGTPDNCTLIPDDAKITLSEDEDLNHFMVCYVPVAMLKG